MDAYSDPPFKSSIDTSTLLSKLATALPIDVSLRIYHLSTPPSRATALYSAPPGTRPERTYCESHFLAASITIPSNGEVREEREVLVYAVEILIYSTAYSSTFFVSKADSTGYLNLLNLKRGTPSPIRDITSTFLSHLVDTHQRPNIRSVISLFARAQDQYLFPGSREYGGKHILDDRGLVRWWCRVLDPIIKESQKLERIPSKWDAVHGYLTIPGIDSHETLSYVPKTTTPNPTWTMGHPLLEISRHSVEVPPRCLIPHFPDDPKARFLDELDEEISKGSSLGGHWKSVRSIAEFWEMMAFRQECSAGNLVGFIWIVFSPQLQPPDSMIGDSQASFTTTSSQTWEETSFQSKATEHSSFNGTPATSFIASSQPNPSSSPLKVNVNDSFEFLKNSSLSTRHRTPKKKKLTGPIVPRQPRIKTENKAENKNDLLERPEKTPYYVWTPQGRGQIIVEESEYKRVTELLLHLDFANINLATSSSSRWINEARSEGSRGMKDAWGETVTGTKAFQARVEAGAAGVNTLNIGLVRKKRKGSQENLPPPQVNVLSISTIRKKPKV